MIEIDLLNAVLYNVAVHRNVIMTLNEEFQLYRCV
jgi:hypothetical protein